VVCGVTLVTHELFVRLSFVAADTARAVLTHAIRIVQTMITLRLVLSCTQTDTQTVAQRQSHRMRSVYTCDQSSSGNGHNRPYCMHFISAICHSEVIPISTSSTGCANRKQSLRKILHFRNWEQNSGHICSRFGYDIWFVVRIRTPFSSTTDSVC